MYSTYIKTMQVSDVKTTTYENITPSKLLNYLRKADLVAFITPQSYGKPPQTRVETFQSHSETYETEIGQQSRVY